MDFAPSSRALDLTERVRTFVAEEIEPVEAQYHRDLSALRNGGGDVWTPLPLVAELQARARAQGLWNLFLPLRHAGEYARRFGTDGGEGLSNTDYAPIAELTGRSALAPHVFNCNAPDTGNMEVLLRYGTDEQRAQWLEPLLEARLRSAFTMTEPDVASSDATNMVATAVVDGDEVVVNGRKWWSTGVGHPDCKIFVFMGLTDPEADRHSRHTMVLVPRDTPGVRVERMLSVMGMYDEPHGHGEVSFTDVRVPLSNVLLGPGRAFEIAQGRLGPGRIHHCMRLVGLAERALELACRRASERTAFGRPLASLGGNRERIADARIAIDQARLLVLHAAWQLDTEQPGRPVRGQPDQGGRPQHGPAGHRHGDAAARRWWLLRGLPARRSVGQRSVPADGRRAGRGAPRRDRPARAREVHMSRVLVTGGAGGLGHALVERFAHRGDQVLATDVLDRRVAPGGTSVDYRQLDVRSEEDWEAARAWVEARWGGLDLLVNNAGVAGGGRIELCSVEDWQRVCDVNLFGVVRGTRAFVPMLQAQRSGRIVNIASLAGLVHPPGMGSYNAVKAAVVAFSETTAHELAPYGVGCSVVCPSYFRTSLMDSMRGDDEDLATRMTRLVEQSSISAEDIAAAVVEGVERGDELILPDQPARTAYALKLSDRSAYDGQMRATAARAMERRQ